VCETELLLSGLLKVGGWIVGFFVIRRVFLSANNCLTDKTNQTPLICDTEPSEHSDCKSVYHAIVLLKMLCEMLDSTDNEM